MAACVCCLHNNMRVCAHCAQILDGSWSSCSRRRTQDNNGNTNDAVTAGDVVGNNIVNAIKAVNGDEYMWTDIAPCDDKDGGIPGGNIRVAYLYKPACVELAPSAESRKGMSLEPVRVVGSGDGTLLSVNPGAQQIFLPGKLAT